MQEEIENLIDLYGRFIRAYEKLPKSLQVILLVLAFALVTLLYLLYPPF